MFYANQALFDGMNFIVIQIISPILYLKKWGYFIEVNYERLDDSDETLAFLPIKISVRRF